MYKIKRHTAYLLIILAIFAQVSLSNFLSFTSIKPNVMIIVTIFFALFTDGKFGFRVGAVCGMLLDIFSTRLFGVNTILLSFCGYMVGRYNTKFYRDSVITYFIITFAVSFFILLSNLAFLHLRNLSTLPPLGISIIFKPSIFISASLNSFLGICIYAPLCRLFGISEYEI